MISDTQSHCYTNYAITGTDGRQIVSQISGVTNVTPFDIYGRFGEHSALLTYCETEPTGRFALARSLSRVIITEPFECYPRLC